MFEIGLEDVGQWWLDDVEVFKLEERPEGVENINVQTLLQIVVGSADLPQPGRDELRGLPFTFKPCVCVQVATDVLNKPTYRVALRPDTARRLASELNRVLQAMQAAEQSGE